MNIDQLVRDADPAALLTIPDPPRVGEIMALGRASQRRRRRQLAAGITAVTAAAAMVLGLGLTGAFGSAPARGSGTIRTAAFTLTMNANGTATLTLKLNVALEPSVLESDLRQDGIPALVTSGSFCSSDPAPAGFTQVMSVAGQKFFRTMTINPAAMPAGTELSFGYFQTANAAGTGHQGQETAIELIDTNSYTCTSTAPLTNGGPWPPPAGGLIVVNAPPT
jgi:hypothetical protein